MKILYAFALLAGLASTASGATFQLDFGPNKSFDGLNAQGATADVAGVANVSGTSINARFSALNSWSFTQPNRSTGAVSNRDFGIRADEGETARIRLQLFDASVGDGFQALYAPTTPYEWSLAFYDIDSDPNGNADGTSFDSFLLRTPGTLSVASDTALTVSQKNDGVLVSATSTRVNTNTNSGVASLTAEQQRYAAIYTLANRSTVDFDYIIGALEDANDRPRIAFIDGGSLTISNPDVITVAPVPLPAGITFLLTALGAIGIVTRFRRA
jgi:hypothetical protein